MPRLVLYDDRGREIWSRQVPEAAVQTAAAVLERVLPVGRAAVSIKRAFDELAELFPAAPPPRLNPQRPPRKPRR